MRIVDLTPEREPLFIACLEDWSDEIREAGDHRARWLARMKPRGLRAKLALDDSGVAGGMIQVLPVEEVPDVEGAGCDMVLCVWVHGHRQGRGDFQGRGMGSALLAAAEADSRALGRTGMAAWGLVLPVWMRASWYRRRGYRTADRRGIKALLWKPFEPGAPAPRWIPETGRRPELAPGKVTVTSCLSGWCTGLNLAHERARRAAEPFGDQVALRCIDGCDREAVRAWGRSDALFVDGREVRTGPPPSRARLQKIIARRVRRLPAGPR